MDELLLTMGAGQTVTARVSPVKHRVKWSVLVTALAIQVSDGGVQHRILYDIILRVHAWRRPMKSLIARCVIGGLLLSTAMAAAFDPPVDRCNNVPDKELFSCLKPILDAMDTKPIRNAAGQTLFEEVMSKKPLPSGNDAQALERQRAQRERLQSEIHANTSDISSGIEADLENALKAIITRCKSSDNVDTCILTKVESKRSFYEAFLDKTAPAAWPDVDIISFSFFHVTQKIAQEQIRCNALESSAKQSCLEQIPTLVSDARDEARHILIGKGTAYGNRQAAERKIGRAHV